MSHLPWINLTLICFHSFSHFLFSFLLSHGLAYLCSQVAFFFYFLWHFFFFSSLAHLRFFLAFCSSNTNQNCFTFFLSSFFFSSFSSCTFHLFSFIRCLFFSFPLCFTFFTQHFSSTSTVATQVNCKQVHSRCSLAHLSASLLLRTLTGRHVICKCLLWYNLHPHKQNGLTCVIDVTVSLFSSSSFSLSHMLPSRSLLFIHPSLSLPREYAIHLTCAAETLPPAYVDRIIWNIIN